MSYKFDRIASGISGAEGPVFDHQGRFICVAPSKGQLLIVNIEDGTTTELANTGGIPAGLQVDRNNDIWVADMKMGIFRVTSEGEVIHEVSEFEGEPIRGCNDCALDGSGGLYVTAPAGSNAKKPAGEIYCRKADGTVVKLDEGFHFCNGLAVNHDDRLLVVAETFTKKLWAYDIKAQGKVANKRLFATLSGDHHGGPDGIDFDDQGHLLSTNWGGSSIEVFSPDGSMIDRIELPISQPSNLHFGGDDRKDLYITEHTTPGIIRTRWRHAGQPERW